MIKTRDIERNLAKEPVEILFYEAIEKEGKRMLKPLSFKGALTLGIIRAVLDNTITSNFYETLSKDLIKKGVLSGSTIQLRAKFNENHTLYDPVLKGTKVICEIKV